jgi:hypothetical protein
MFQAKLNEVEFYRNLSLSQDAKKRIFDLDAKPLVRPRKIICWDPVQGNLVMTYEEYKKRYNITSDN